MQVSLGLVLIASMLLVSNVLALESSSGSIRLEIDGRSNQNDFGQCVPLSLILLTRYPVISSLIIVTYPILSFLTHIKVR